MGQVLSDTQVSYGTDLITTGDAVEDYSLPSNVTNASPTISGFAASIQFGNNSIPRYALKTYSKVSGKNYAVSFFIQMDDGLAPVPGTPTTGDFAVSFNNSFPSGITTIRLITGSIYRVSIIFASTVTQTFQDGIYTYTTNSGRLFKIAGYAVNEVTTAVAPNPILSICEDGATAIGRRCTVAQVIDTSYQITGSISDAVAITAEFQADGTGVSGAHRGVVLAPLAAYSNGQNTTGFDGGAASSNGIVANLHVLSAGGSTTVKIQHSTDNSSWTDLVTFTTGAVQFCEHKTTTGTVHRYLRVNVVTDGLPVMVVTAARK
jgi:hypothetical protein